MSGVFIYLSIYRMDAADTFGSSPVSAIRRFLVRLWSELVREGEERQLPPPHPRDWPFAHQPALPFTRLLLLCLNEAPVVPSLRLYCLCLSLEKSRRQRGEDGSAET